MPLAKHFAALPRLAAAALTLFAAAACGDGGGGGVVGPPRPPPVASVAVTYPGGPAQVGSTVQFSATPKDAAGNALAGREMSWASSDTMIATVDAAGLMKARSPGSATITATSEGMAGRATAQVIPVPVASVTVGPAGPLVVIGTTQQMEVSTLDANGNVLSGRAVAWTSSDPTVAAVSSTGVVTGQALGSARITATSEGRSGWANVAVVPVPIATLSVEVSPAVILPGATATLRVVARDAAGNVLTGRTPAVGSSDMNVAVVTSSGVVTGIAEGRATITASAEGKTASADITVLPVPVATLTVSVSPATIQAGSTGQLTLVARDARGNVLPGRAATLTVANGAVASVDANRVVSGLAPGTTAITATSESVTATTNVTVTSGPAANLVIDAGNNQTVEVRKLLQPLVVRVTDRLGHPVAGAPIRFASSQGGRFVTPDHVATNADGRTSLMMELSNIAGPHPVTATLTTATPLTVTFAVTAVPGPVATMSVQPNPVVLAVGETRQMTVTARDQYGNNVPTTGARWFASLDGKTSISAAGALQGLVRGGTVVTAELAGRTAQGEVWVYTGPDTGAPLLLNGINARPATVDARYQAVEVTVSLGLRDLESGVASFTVNVLAPNGDTRTLGGAQCRVTSYSSDGSRFYSCRTTIAAGSASGTWLVQSITAADHVGNTRTFTRADIVARGGESSFVVVGQ